jgi:Bacterial dnaA protein helix-turn-helix
MTYLEELHRARKERLQRLNKGMPQKVAPKPAVPPPPPPPPKPQKLKIAGFSELFLLTICKYVATEFGVSVAQLRGHSRKAELVAPRHLAITLSKYLGGYSKTAIGHWYGGRDHTCVENANRKYGAAVELAIQEVGRDDIPRLVEVARAKARV